MEEERAREPLLVEQDAVMAERAALRKRLEKWASEHALSIARLFATGIICSCGRDCFVCQAKVMYEEDRALLDRYLAPGADAVIAAERRYQDAVSRALGLPLRSAEDP